MAVGDYHEITGPPPYKSVFIFAKLDEPLISLELATIEGIRLGFGYNSFVQPPDLNNLTSFPFITDNTSGPTDPMQSSSSHVASSISSTRDLLGRCRYLAP